MFLKRIAISGFKSFCDRVDFDFEPGVTCVVGPNGCGKSNLVDAFKWVLGEQSAHSLRGRHMTDMIFSGSSARRGSSLAQVDLVFDNADRRLPLDLDEITVSRRLHRSGESEYLLNQQGSRLKDIREMFLDTGVGVEAYSVIEQGKVDTLLKSSPTDRRIIFEEAAGISRYKARRKEAERKLERTQQNLLRVADIIEELEKRLRSVKLQAGKARSYLEYDAKLRELKSSFAMAEYHRFTQSVTELNRQIDADQDQATAVRTAIDRHEAEAAEKTVQLDALVERIGGTDSELIRARADLAAQEERIASSGRRVEEQTAQLALSEERLRVGEARLGSLRHQLAAAEQNVTEFEARTRELHGVVDDLNEQDRTFARQLAQGQAALEDEKAGIIELLRRSAQVHNEVIRLNTHRESLVGQKGRLSSREEQIQAELTGLLTQRAEVERKISEISDLIGQQTRHLEHKKEEAARIHGLRQRIVDELASARERRSALQSRREVLEDLERRMEGVGAGPRRVWEAKAAADGQGIRHGIVGLVGDLFEADVRYARLVEGVLGEADQHLVVADERAFLAFVESLGELPGRVGAYCLDRLPPVVNERDFSERPGVLARMLDVVRYPAEVESLAKQLFGKTILVEDLSVAQRLAADDVHGHRFVTAAGEVMEPSGRLSVGPVTAGAGLILRRSELKDIAAQLVQISENVDRLTDQLNRTDAEASHLETVQQELRSAVYESNTSKVEAAAALDNVQEAIDRLSRERPLIAREVEFLEQQMQDVLQRAEQGSRSLEEMEAENRRRQEEVEAQQQRIDDVVARRRVLQDQLTETRVLAGQLAEKRIAATEACNSLRREIAELEAGVASARQEMEQCRGRIEEAAGVLARAREQVARLSARIEELDVAATDLRREREAMRLELENLHHSVRAARSGLADTESRLHQHQMSLAELTVRRDDLVARVREELSLDLAERYAQYEYQEQDWASVETEMAELRGKMDRLGNVNLDAIHELAEIEERHTFLTRQRDDLNESQRQLQELIARLNDESREQFRVTLEQIREHFRALFRRLFGGGRADILLEDPENLLECGIEIMAQPPGKELQSINLMSGGEKSMTAIALLMSIFKTRPAPFTILDEVDAALDEANNQRFNAIVQEFQKSTQFIIITHSKWTMNTAARLYGITMQEPGVSTRVSVELGGAEAQVA
jgi:chromosome segregation protein